MCKLISDRVCASRFLLCSLMAIGALTFLGVPAYATPLTLGTILPNYAVVSVGPFASIMVNSGPITGNVLLGDGTTSSSSGGGGGLITGVVDVSPPVSGDFLGNLNTPPTTVLVPLSVGMQAFTDANNLAAAASALTPTQTFSSITGTQTITGDGGLNVIDIGSLTNPLLTISGNASDIFVINVSGNFQTNQVMTLNGVTASQILWNLTGTFGNILQTSGGDALFGTFLATGFDGNFQFSNLVLTGELINTDGHMQIVSGSQIISNQPFVGTPEPSSLALLGVGLTLGWFGTRRARGKI